MESMKIPARTPPPPSEPVKPTYHQTIEPILEAETGVHARLVAMNLNDAPVKKKTARMYTFRGSLRSSSVYNSFNINI